MKPRAGVPAVATKDRLRKRQQEVRKERRDTLTKRRRAMPMDSSHEGGVGATAETSASLPGQEIFEGNSAFADGALEVALNTLRSNSSSSTTTTALASSTSHSLQLLRRALCCLDFPIQVALDTGVMSCLIHNLRTSTDEKAKSDTVWCLTNIATGNHEQTGAVLQAMPELLQLVAGAGQVRVSVCECVCV